MLIERKQKLIKIPEIVWFLPVKFFIGQFFGNDQSIANLGDQFSLFNYLFQK